MGNFSDGRARSSSIASRVLSTDRHEQYLHSGASHEREGERPTRDTWVLQRDPSPIQGVPGWEGVTRRLVRPRPPTRMASKTVCGRFSASAPLGKVLQRGCRQLPAWGPVSCFSPTAAGPRGLKQKPKYIRKSDLILQPLSEAPDTVLGAGDAETGG